MIDPSVSLVRAVKAGDLTLTTRLLASGTNPDSTDAEGSTPLMTAVAQGRDDLVSLLLKVGANAKARNKNGDTALDMACRADPPVSGVIAALLAQDRAGAGRALIQAIRAGSKSVVIYLSDNGADVNARDEHGATPLMIAAGMGRMEMVKFLLDKGADVNARDKTGVTALGWAYAPPAEADVPLKTRREIVQVLKQFGARSGAIVGLD
jgi:ankyrin repeat protein